MKFLIDTNVLSEALRKRPDDNVAAWFRQTDDSLIYISVATIAEIRKGVTQLPKGKRRDRIDKWLMQGLLQQYAKRIVPVDAEVALVCGELMAEHKRAGYVLYPMDAIIAASALAHGCTLVTRNIRDFERCGASLVNPWDWA